MPHLVRRNEISLILPIFVSVFALLFSNKRLPLLLFCLLTCPLYLVSAGCTVPADLKGLFETETQNKLQIQLTHHPSNDFSPAWSTGDRIAFISDRTGSWNIWSMDRDGSDQRPLTEDTGQATTPAWSPDGKLLVFSSDRTSQTRLWPDLWILDSGEQHLKRITDTPVTKEFFPAWSPDGNWIVYMSLDMTSTPAWRIMLMELRTGQEKEIRRNEILFSRLAWSPDGKQIAFLSDLSGRPELWLMDRDGLQARPITRDQAAKEHPAWSPDGGQIAFASDRSGSWDLWTVRPDGTNLRRVTTSPYVENMPDWSPDGRSIVFTSDQSGNQDIWVLKVRGF